MYFGRLRSSVRTFVQTIEASPGVGISSSSTISGCSFIGWMTARIIREPTIAREESGSRPPVRRAGEGAGDRVPPIASHDEPGGLQAGQGPEHRPDRLAGHGPALGADPRPAHERRPD